MATFTAVSRDELRGFLDGYGLSLSGVGGIPEGSVNSNYWVHVARAGAPERLFLRLYEEQDAEGAEGEAALLAQLEAGGVPTPAPLRAKSGAVIGRLSGKPAALFPWRQGTMRCQAAVAAGDVTAVGAALARVHVAGKGLSRGPGRFRRADLERRLEAVSAAPDATLRALAGPLRARLAEVDDARDRALPSGLVHGDLFRDNVLFADASSARVVALLDFESAFDGTFAFDLAVCLLSWTYGDDLDLGLGRAMVQGYESVRPLTPAERAGLYEEARFAALRFTVTRITDFAMRASEGPRVVKDYRRFWARFERLTALEADGLTHALGLR